MRYKRTVIFYLLISNSRNSLESEEFRCQLQDYVFCLSNRGWIRQRPYVLSRLLAPEYSPGKYLWRTLTLRQKSHFPSLKREAITNRQTKEWTRTKNVYFKWKKRVSKVESELEIQNRGRYYLSHSQSFVWKFSFNGKAHLLMHLDSVSQGYFGGGRWGYENRLRASISWRRVGDNKHSNGKQRINSTSL